MLPTPIRRLWLLPAPRYLDSHPPDLPPPHGRVRGAITSGITSTAARAATTRSLPRTGSRRLPAKRRRLPAKRRRLLMTLPVRERRLPLTRLQPARQPKMLDPRTTCLVPVTLRRARCRPLSSSWSWRGNSRSMGSRRPQAPRPSTRQPARRSAIRAPRKSCRICWPSSARTTARQNKIKRAG